MKNLLLMLIVYSCLLTGCSLSGNQEKIKYFIPGTYARDFEGEFSKGRDTLIISLISKDGNAYLIKRKTTFQRIKDGKELPKERKMEDWTAIFDSKEKVLRETEKGKVLFFFPEKHLLFVGSSQYQKMEDD